MLLETWYTVTSNKGGDYIANKSRADYFKERRKKIGQFNIEIDREKLDKLDEILDNQGKTKTDWLNEKIDEEISK